MPLSAAGLNVSIVRLFSSVICVFSLFSEAFLNISCNLTIRACTGILAKGRCDIPELLSLYNEIHQKLVC